MIAALLAPREPHALAKRVEQRAPGIDLDRLLLAVHVELHVEVGDAHWAGVRRRAGVGGGWNLRFAPLEEREREAREERRHHELAAREGYRPTSDEREARLGERAMQRREGQPGEYVLEAYDPITIHEEERRLPTRLDPPVLLHARDVGDVELVRPRHPLRLVVGAEREEPVGRQNEQYGAQATQLGADRFEVHVVRPTLEERENDGLPIEGLERQRMTPARD